MKYLKSFESLLQVEADIQKNSEYLSDLFVEWADKWGLSEVKKLDFELLENPIYKLFYSYLQTVYDLRIIFPDDYNISDEFRKDIVKYAKRLMNLGYTTELKLGRILNPYTFSSTTIIDIVITKGEMESAVDWIDNIKKFLEK